MDDLIVEFLTETNESIGELDNDLVLLEQDAGNADLLSRIFRVMHTIKGTSGFLNLPRLGKVAHKAEDLLGLFRDGKLTPDPAYITLILEALDVIKSITAAIAVTGEEPAGDDSDLTVRLTAAASGKPIAANATAEPPIVVTAAYNDPFEELFANTPVLENYGLPPDAPVMDALPESKIAPAQLPAAAVPYAPVAAPHATTTPNAAAAAAEAAQSLRVSVEVLENLMTMVSELVLTRNQLLQFARVQKDHGLATSLQRLNHIVSDLQEGVMKTRMQPVGNAWAKLPRIVRDIALDLGKKIELEMKGQETELDRQVLDLIKDPLTHMVRNSCDHGIETPADRRMLGKPETGKVRLGSWHEGGYIIIELADDGKGLNLDRIKRKIVQTGLATDPEVAAMTSAQIQQYIFAAGFSTAEAVTAVSGRGVGMDVVRSNIEKISGSIEMKSIEGEGTTFTIKIPLTLAIVSALIVGVDAERFAIPQLDVRELVMISPQSTTRIETIRGSSFYRLRDRLLPLISLRDLLQLGGEELPPDRPRYIAVMQLGTTSFGLLVEQVFDTEEIVVKPMASLLRQQNVFSGNTILGDGQVIMILDPAGILKTTGIHNEPMVAADADAEAQHGEDIPLLTFKAGTGKSMKAVALKHVARLEEVDLATLEWAGGQRVVQYRGSLMPIYQCSDEALPETGRRPVIVFATRTGLAGLMVERILDIAAFQGEYQIKSEGRLEGSAIVQGQATDIINLSYSATPPTPPPGNDSSPAMPALPQAGGFF